MQNHYQPSTLNFGRRVLNDQNRLTHSNIISKISISKVIIQILQSDEPSPK
jgi:hypothetical protein